MPIPGKFPFTRIEMLGRGRAMPTRTYQSLIFTPHEAFNGMKEFSALPFVVQDISTKLMGHEDRYSELNGRIFFTKHN